MLSNDRLRMVILLIGPSAVFLGCLERKETIRVARDGSAQLEVSIEGDPGDISNGDALPDDRSGWQLQTTLTKDDKGKEKERREARLLVRPGEPLPGSFALPHHLQRATALTFPTKLDIERRADGTYYHFTRVYHGREYARYDILKNIAKSSGSWMDTSRKDPAKLTAEERANLLELLWKVEGLKRAEYVNVAAAALADRWPQHYGLLIRRAVLDYFEQVDTERALALLKQHPSSERNAAIDMFGTQMIEGTRKEIDHKLEELAVGHGEAEAFFSAYNEERDRHAVTEDLQDEWWEIRLSLPGDLVAHNGASVEGEFVVWGFTGEELRDRNVILMATSRIGHDKPSENDGN